MLGDHDGSREEEIARRDGHERGRAIGRVVGRIEKDHREAPSLASQHAERTLHVLTGWALERGVELEGLTVSRPSLEDVYLEMVGR